MILQSEYSWVTSAQIKNQIVISDPEAPLCVFSRCISATLRLVLSAFKCDINYIVHIILPEIHLCCSVVVCSFLLLCNISLCAFIHSVVIEHLDGFHMFGYFMNSASMSVFVHVSKCHYLKHSS